MIRAKKLNPVKSMIYDNIQITFTMKPFYIPGEKKNSTLSIKQQQL